MCYNDCKGLPRLSRGGAGCAGGGQLSRLAERTSGLPERRDSHESPAIRSFPAVLDAAFLPVGRGCPGRRVCPCPHRGGGTPRRRGGGRLPLRRLFGGGGGFPRPSGVRPHRAGVPAPHLRGKRPGGDRHHPEHPGQGGLGVHRPGRRALSGGGGRHYLPLPHLGKRCPRPGHGVRLRL